jgi:hypothetical protein
VSLSGAHNPESHAIINAVRAGIEFVLDVAPAIRKPALVTARAQRRGAIPMTMFRGSFFCLDALSAAVI